MSTNYNLPIILIHWLFILYFIASLFVIDSNAFIYGTNLVMLPFLFLYLLHHKHLYLSKSHPIYAALFIFLIFLILFPPIHKESLYIKIFIVKMILLTFLILNTPISLKSFTRLLNSTYLLYLFFSVIVWLKLLPGYNYGDVNSFIISVGSFQFETLYGISGSTADIDSYSALVFLWNLLLNKEKGRNFFLTVSLIAVFLAFRSTPIVGLILSEVVYFTVRHKITAFLALFSIFLGLAITTFILSTIPTFNVPFLSSEMTWDTFFWNATHARSSLWVQQMIIFLSDYSWYDYIIGPDLQNLTVSFITPDGIERHETYNPHNSYFLMLYRSSVLFVALYCLFLYYGSKSFIRKTFPIVFFIALAATTNSSLFGLENPVYILILLYLFIYSKQIQQDLSKG